MLERVMFHVRPALFFVVIGLVAFFAGCAAKQIVEPGTERVLFALHKVSRADLDSICGLPHYGKRILACAVGHAIYMPVRSGEPRGTTYHNFMLRIYSVAPCPTACVIGGEVHSETEAWGAPLAAIAGRAVIEATGVRVAKADAATLWHEVKHVRGHQHE